MASTRIRPSTRYRYGARDRAARADHSTASRSYRRALADADFDDATRAAFLAALAVCADVVSAAATVGYTHGVIYGRMRYDPVFTEEVEAILSATCRAIQYGCCGSEAGYKRGGRCWSCRSAHHARS